MTVSRMCSWCSTDSPPSARAWPSVRRPSADGLLDARGEIEQAQRVRDRRSGAADPRGDRLVGETELVDELTVPVRRLDRVEILALQVLDQRELELCLLVELADDGRDAIEAGRGRGPESALPGDEAVAIDRLGHEDRLEDAVLEDARGQRREVRLVEVPSWLVRVVADPGDGDLRGVGMPTGALRDEGRQPATKTLGSVRPDGHDSTRACGSGSIGIATGSRRINERVPRLELVGQVGIRPTTARIRRVVRDRRP